MPWTVAQTHPNAAGVACMNLQRQGFAFYNPLFKERVKLKRGIGWRTVQLFSNYLFVEILDQWRAVKSTRGISQLLMSEIEKPAVVSDSYITWLKTFADVDGVVAFNKSKFIRGEAVQVKSGSFAYSICQFDGLSSHDRVFVLMSMLGTQRRIEMNEDNLIAV